jgi:N-acetylglucosamine kinase-like BadF-type ATPase
VFDQGGTIIGNAQSGPSNHYTVGQEVAYQSLSSCVGSALATAGLLAADVAGVAVASAGVDLSGLGADIIVAFVERAGFRPLLVCSDIEAAHAAAFSGKAGVLVLSGTGSAVYGVSPKGKSIRVGGWGPVFGDQGSAYDLGQKALVAAARSWDLVGPQTLLVNAMSTHFRIKDFPEVIAHIYSAGDLQQVVSSLSEIVLRLVEQDSVAREIVSDSATDLARSVTVLISRLELDEETPPVSYQGGLLNGSAYFRSVFSSELSRQVPSAVLSSPDHDLVIGVFLLANKARRSAFRIRD